jgi:hypothetical protein
MVHLLPAVLQHSGGSILYQAGGLEYCTDRPRGTASCVAKTLEWRLTACLTGSVLAAVLPAGCAAEGQHTRATPAAAANPTADYTAGISTRA